MGRTAIAVGRTRAWLVGAWLAALLFVGVWVPGTAVARAGVWAQVTCSQPDGQPAPTEGWGQEAVGGPGDDSNAYSTCGQAGGALVAESSSQSPQARYSGYVWHYVAPNGSTIAGGTLSLGLYAPRGVSYVATPNNSSDDGADVVKNCQFNLPCLENGLDGGPFAGTVAISHPGGTSIYVEAQCVGSGAPETSTEACAQGDGDNGVNAQATIYAAEIELANESTPTGAGFSGTLLGVGASGTADLTFTAQDPGGPGVYRVIATVDGTQVYSGTPEANGGSCASIGKDSGGVAEFLHAQPCKQTVAVDLPVDTSKLSDGSHALKVAVEDVAGDSAVVLDREITVANAPPASATTPGASIGPGSPLALRGPANGVKRLRSGQADRRLGRGQEGGAYEPLRAAQQNHGSSHDVDRSGDLGCDARRV